MALDFLTIAQGRVCALLGAECCVYMPDSCNNVKMGLQPVMQEIEKVTASHWRRPAGVVDRIISHLALDFSVRWWNSQHPGSVLLQPLLLLWGADPGIGVTHQRGIMEDGLHVDCEARD